jgi:UDP-N-acetylmuramoyl-L-alanyl-D-glutamate--2,6-diaminopimelate ligase
MYQDHPVQKLKNLIHKFQSIYANVKYNFPAKKLKIIGITGTDGKTTCTSMLYHIFNQSNQKIGYISTIEAKIGNKVLDTGLHVTTPEPWEVPKYLQMMLDENIEYVILESTSNGLHQNRLWGINFDSVAITNIRYDHLDYHKTWENYADAKFSIIQKLASGGLAVINKDDQKSYSYIKTKLQKSILDIKINEFSKNDLKILQQDISGYEFIYKDQIYKFPLLGEYNLENALTVINIALKYLDAKQIAKSLETYKPPKGRMDLIMTEPFAVIVDFAHTPGALQNALMAVNMYKSDNNKLITVFGCAGKRDVSRRKMGEVSAQLSDITILTAEDPRDEQLRDINDEILQHAKAKNGVLLQRFANSREFTNINFDQLDKLLDQNKHANQKPFFAFDENSTNSRQDAIELALKLAKKGDIVFITGKAHEQSLAFGKDETEYPWSDHDQIARILKRINLHKQ